MDNIEIKNLLIVNDYYRAERYPGAKYFMPDREEINNYNEMNTVAHWARRINKEL